MEKVGHGFFDALEGCEFELLKYDARGFLVSRLELFDGLLGLLLRPGCEVTASSVVGAELLHRLESQACISAGNDDNLVLEIGNIIARKGGHDGGGGLGR